jgi:hypothetical protein
MRSVAQHGSTKLGDGPSVTAASYERVSTRLHGQSGFSLAAQQRMQPNSRQRAAGSYPRTSGSATARIGVPVVLIGTCPASTR